MFRITIVAKILDLYERSCTLWVPAVWYRMCPVNFNCEPGFNVEYPKSWFCLGWCVFPMGETPSESAVPGSPSQAKQIISGWTPNGWGSPVMCFFCRSWEPGNPSTVQQMFRRQAFSLWVSSVETDFDRLIGRKTNRIWSGPSHDLCTGVWL